MQGMVLNISILEFFKFEILYFSEYLIWSYWPRAKSYDICADIVYPSQVTSDTYIRICMEIQQKLKLYSS